MTKSKAKRGGEEKVNKTPTPAADCGEMSAPPLYERVVSDLERTARETEELRCYVSSIQRDIKYTRQRLHEMEVNYEMQVGELKRLQAEIHHLCTIIPS